MAPKFRVGSAIGLLALSFALFVVNDWTESASDAEEVLRRGPMDSAHDGRNLRGAKAADAAARDCQMGAWTEWDPCTVQCGGVGVRMRSRAILRPPQYGGRRCLPTLQSWACNVDAELGPCSGGGGGGGGGGAAAAAALRATPPPTPAAAGGVRYFVTTPYSGIAVPTFIYGTAWKKDRTDAAAYGALQRHGFGALDTANQARHYSEAGVGAALRRAYERDGRLRGDFFLQTKFSHGQWAGARHAHLSTAQRVHASVLGSLAHLRTDHVDALLLHGPTDRRSRALPAADWEAWRAMEREHDAGRALSLGVSNVNAHQLRELLASARVKPEYVQKRTFARTGWEREIRSICREHGLVYEAYSLLTANRAVLADDRVAAIANRHGVTPEVALFRYALQAGMVPLTGSTSDAHLSADRTAYGFELSPSEFKTFDRIGGS